MPRRRFGVAILFEDPLSTWIDGLRRACGDGALSHVPPHITLVPPVNVGVDQVDDARAVLAAAAKAHGPLRLEIGPADTFHPVTPVLHLAVHGDVDAVRSLHEAVFQPPLHRPPAYPYVPHVTIADEMAAPRIEAALVALADFRAATTVEEIHLMEEQGPQRVWRPIETFDLR